MERENNVWEDNPKYVEFNNKIARIKEGEFDWDVDLDDLTDIHYENIIGEQLTISTLLNRASRLYNKIENFYKRQRYELEEKEAKVRKIFRKKEMAAGKKKPSIQEVDDHLLEDAALKSFKFRLIDLEKDKDDIASLRDSLKEKSFKLNTLSKNIVPEEIENNIVDGMINGMLIKIRDRKFKIER